MRKILAIDDHTDNLLTIEAVIKSNMTDCLILKSLSGEQGIAVAQKEQPDTIILDLVMPGIDGFEVCKRLKNDTSTSHIPIIILTSKSDDNKSKIKSLELGADAFLAKPINSLELIAQIKVMLRVKSAENKLRIEKENLENLIIERTEKLKRSEEKFKTLFRSTALPICYVEKDEIISLRNDRFTQTFGYTAEDVPSLKEWWQKAYPEEKYREWVIKNWESAVEKASKTGEDIKSDEYLVTCKNGSLRNTIISGNTLGDNYLATFIDITERKQYEDALQKSNALLTSIINSPNNIIMFASDSEFNYLNFNQAHKDAVKHACGTEPEIGKNILSYIPVEQDRLKAEANYRRVLKGERFVEIQEFRTEETQSTWQLIFNPIINTSDKITGFTVFIQDISERKQIEGKLLESEEKYKTMFELSPSAIMISNAAGDIIEVNTAMTAITGFTKEEIKTIGGAKIIAPEVLEATIKDWTSQVEKIGMFKIETKWVGKNGQRISVFVVGKPIEIAGEPMFEVIATDITDRRLAEEELKSHKVELEKIVAERTNELEEKYTELERMNHLFVGRELRMVQLKQKIKELENK